MFANILQILLQYRAHQKQSLPSPVNLNIGVNPRLSHLAQLENFRRAANYVDRILKAEKPVELPVQTPTKYELIFNLKTAKTLA